MPALQALRLFAQLGKPIFARRSLLLPDQRGPGSGGESHEPAPSRREKGDSHGCEVEADTTLFLVEGTVAAVVCGRRLRVQWPEEARRDAGGLEPLPDFISLPRDEEGSPIIRTPRVTALVGFRWGRGGGDCGFIIHRPAAARARSWRRLRRGDGCPASMHLAIRPFGLFGGPLAAAND